MLSDKGLKKDENVFFMLITLECVSDPTDPNLPSTYDGKTASYNKFIINLTEYCTHRFYYDEDVATSYSFEFLKKDQTVQLPALVSQIEGCEFAEPDTIVVTRQWAGISLENYWQVVSDHEFIVNEDALAGQYSLTLNTRVDDIKTYKIDIAIEIVYCETASLTLTGKAEYRFTQLTSAEVNLLAAASNECPHYPLESTWVASADFFSEVEGVLLLSASTPNGPYIVEQRIC